MATHSATSVHLNTGYEMPRLGLGTFTHFEKGGIATVVKTAIGCGYRLLDCAWLYKNEDEIGNGIKELIDGGRIKREELFITSKIFGFFHQPEKVEPALRQSLSELKLDYLDLYLMHWPFALKEPKDMSTWDLFDDFEPSGVDYVDTYKAMEKLVDKGLVRSIGISNFNMSQLKRLLGSGIKYKPANLQIEIHPYLMNEEMIKFCQDNDISVTGYTPLARASESNRAPNLLEEQVLVDIAKNRGKTPAQVVLRWGLQRGICLVPKSSTPHRIAENIQVFDFELTEKEMSDISSLNKNLSVVYLEKYKSHPDFPY